MPPRRNSPLRHRHGRREPAERHRSGSSGASRKSPSPRSRGSRGSRLPRVHGPRHREQLPLKRAWTISAGGPAACGAQQACVNEVPVQDHLGAGTLKPAFGILSKAHADAAEVASAAGTRDTTASSAPEPWEGCSSLAPAPAPKRMLQPRTKPSQGACRRPPLPWACSGPTAPRLARRREFPARPSLAGPKGVQGIASRPDSGRKMHPSEPTR